MRKIFDVFVDKAGVISQFWLFAAIRRGLLYNLPLFVIGSIVLMLANLPIAPFQTAMNNITVGAWALVLASITNGTLGVMSLGVLLGVTSALSTENKAIIEKKMPSVVPLGVVLCAFLIIVRNGSEVIPIQAAGSVGLFGSILTAIIATPLFFWFYEHRIIKFQVYAYNADNALLQSLSAIEPAALTLLFAAFAKVALNVAGNEIAKAASQSVLTGGGLGVTFAFETISHTLWLFGIHGANLLDNVAKNVFENNSAINSSLSLAGMQPSQIFTKQFLDVFVYMGGSGGMLCLIAAMILRGNKNGSSRFAKLSLATCFFNINEFVIYGLPVVYNPFFAIPFIITPLVLTLTTYLAMVTGLVPLTYNSINWTTPIIMSGILSTGSISGALLQVFNLAIGTLIYLPFVNLYDAHVLIVNKRLLSNLVDKVYSEKEHSFYRFIDRADDMGTVARELAHDIQAALEPGKNSLYMEFQPQISYQGKLIGAEALLRWNHRLFGYIPPQVVIKIATEAGIIDKLGNWIIKNVFSQINYFNRKGVRGIKYAINLTYEQIQSPGLIAYIADQMDAFEVDPETIEFELTEGAAFRQTTETQSVLNGIKRLGAKLAIDDFGMGHSSLIYIKDYNISTVKLDKVLVEDILNDINCQEIISSIASLCKVINMSLIAEHVETFEQTEKLMPLGCDIYQGFLFSKALGRDKFLAFARRYRKSVAGMSSGYTSFGLNLSETEIRNKRELVFK